MVNLNEQIMLNILAKDNASNVAKQIDSSFQGMASNLSKSMSSISSSMMNFSAVSDNALQSLTGKSALDNILGTSSKAETNKVLLKNMTETESAYESLYETVDKTTDNSLTSMQELIPAMNAFKAATGASDKEMISITEDVANFGAAVLAQTGSTELAQGAMMDLSKGIKGAFASLDQYGVSEDALKRTGLWSGKEDDVEGYMAAVTEVIGSTDELMETNEGLDAQIGKTFSRAGKKMGNEFLPIIKDIKKGFIELDNETGGALAGSILAASGAMEVMNQGFWNISTAVNGVNDLKTAFSSLRDIVKSTGKAAEATSDALNMGSNISQIGADVSTASKSMGGAGELALDAGISSFSAIDAMKDAKAQQKELEKAQKEVKKISKRKEALLKNFYDTNDDKLARKLKKGIASADAKLNVGELSSEATASLLNFNEKTIGGFEKSDLDLGLTDFIKDKYNKSMDDAGEAIYDGINSFAGKPQKASQSLKQSLGSFSKSINDSFSSFKGSLETIKADGIKGNFDKIDKKLYQSLKGTSNTVETLESLGDMGEGAGDAMKALKGVEEIEDATETVVGGASAIGALGPEAAAASTEVGATAAATTTLSGAFTSMIVPLLAISAVIIIMLPIVAVIAAEAMVLLKLLGEFMDSLDFGSLDLSSSTKGIKSIAEGLAWVGVAMAAMSFTSVMTGLAFITGGFLGMTTSLEIAKDALMDAADILKEFSTVTIDSSVPTNLKNISDGLSSVSTAMLALTATNITTGFSDFVAWALGFGSVTDGLEEAKNDIIDASAKLQEFKSLTPLDDATANNIQNVCDSLASVGDAMSALRSVRDGVNWDGFMGDLFGGVDIKTALTNVKEDIVDASQALKEFTGLEQVPEGVGTKIKSVADTLKSVSESFQTLRKLRDDTNWDGFVGGIFEGVDIATAITNIRNDIAKVSVCLASLNTIANIDPSVAEKVSNVNTALGKVSEAVKSMQSIPTMEGFSAESVSTAVASVKTAATELAKLSDITLGEDATGVLGTIQTAMETLKTTLSSASGFSAPSTSIGTQIVSGVKTGLAPLNSTVQGAVTSALNSAASSGWTGGSYIGTSATNGFKSSLNLHSVMTTEMGYVKTAVDNGISAAKTAAQNGAKEVVEAFKSGINVGSPGDIARTMSGEMNYTLEAIKNSYSNLKNASNIAARNIVNSFGNPSLNVDSSFSAGQIGSMQTLLSKVPNIPSKGDITIIIGEGAVTVDARNKTEREAQQIMITALESLDIITDIQVNGA